MRPLDQYDSRAPGIKTMFYMISGLYIFLRLLNLANSLWLDEILTLQAARKSFAGLMEFVTDDVVHPPLFYLLVKIWITVGGESNIWMKLLPFTFSGLTIWPFYLLCREMKMRSSEINLALFLMAVNSYLIIYSQEFRMYSLLLFLTMAAIYLFVKFLNTGKYLWILFAADILMVYTHYFGWFVVGTQFISLVIYKRELLLRFAATVLLQVLLFSPWAYIVISTAIQKKGIANIEWITRPGFPEFIFYYVNLSGSAPYTLVSLVGLVVLCIPVAKLLLKLDRNVAVLFLFSTVPVIVSFFVSQKFPIWQHRYLIISSVPFILIVTLSVLRLPGYTMKHSLTLALIIWGAFTGLYGLMSNDRVDWRGLADDLNAVENSPTTINTFGEDQIAVPLSFYLDHRFTVNKVTELPDANEYWVAYRESRENNTLPLEMTAQTRGYKVGRVFLDGREGHQVHLFSVTR